MFILTKLYMVIINYELLRSKKDMELIPYLYLTIRTGHSTRFATL